MNGVLAIRVVLRVFLGCMTRYELVTAVLEPRRSSQRNEPRQGTLSFEDYRVLSVRVGWGAGYWSTSLLALLAYAWPANEYGWPGPPTVIAANSYIIIPCVMVAGLVMVADPNPMGKRLANFVEPAVEILRNRSRVEFWSLATVHHDVIALWLGYRNVLWTQLE